MLSVRLQDPLQQRLKNLAHKTQRSQSFYIQKALVDFLDDEEDYLLAVSRLENKEPRLSLEELHQNLNIETTKTL